MKTRTVIASAGFPILVAAMGIASALPGTAVAADPVRSNEIRLGVYVVLYDAKADNISGPFVPTAPPFGPLNLDVNNVNTVYFAYLRRLSPHFSVELTAGWPPKTETVGKGPATIASVPFNGQVLSTAKWFAPTLLLNYNFRDESEAFRPYVEAGVNFTHFYDRQSTAAGNAANGGPTSISLTNSVGPALTAGISWRIQDHWSLHASYSRSWVKSDYVGNTAGVLRRTHIDFNPSAIVVSAGYSF
jgi:outer membrane protein